MREFTYSRRSASACACTCVPPQHPLGLSRLHSTLPPGGARVSWECRAPPDTSPAAACAAAPLATLKAAAARAARVYMSSHTRAIDATPYAVTARLRSNWGWGPPYHRFTTWTPKPNARHPCCCALRGRLSGMSSQPGCIFSGLSLDSAAPQTPVASRCLKLTHCEVGGGEEVLHVAAVPYSA